MTNHERVGRAIELLRRGLGPFVEREIQRQHGQGKPERETFRYLNDRKLANQPITKWDTHALLKLMWESWNTVFRVALGAAERDFVSELKKARNAWAHQKSFKTDDTYRVLDTTHRLLTSVSATEEAEEAEKMKADLLRTKFSEQARQVRRRRGQGALKVGGYGSLPPWRDVIQPHPDVAEGNFSQAEFAADLWQIYKKKGSSEYLDPAQFFRRTYLTTSLRNMLLGAVERLTSGGADPVVQLQTNFGGGKTHSMLALYHLFSGEPPAELEGVDKLMAEADVQELPSVRRVVLVGNKISPGNPTKKEDGTTVRTLWGELAWQLGGKEAFARVAEDDKNGTNPGSVLTDLFNEYGPCLILIDEWVAYARQLHDGSNTLPGGSFDTQFTFAQALTESAKAASGCLLVVSLPASDVSGSPHVAADDTEVGGTRGRDALNRLSNVVGRVESSWRPATAEEGFAIVRRRLFAPMDENAYKTCDVVAREFVELYKKQKQEFPAECREADYERRIKDAYPIHPELFDRLYEDWSTLLRFQRTRGVLRLMATVIHNLWREADKSPLILPSLVPVDDPRVQSELTNYLPDQWTPIIKTDVDGTGSLPVKLDLKYSNLGKISACRRVARTVWIGSAPLKAASRRGIDDRHVNLGCVLPGEAPAVFGDALRRLVGGATHLYQDGPRVWYDTQPTVAKLARDRAADMENDPDKVAYDIRRRVEKDASEKGDFHGVHCFPREAADVPDKPEVRLVILGGEYSYVKGGGSPAENAAREILNSRGTGPILDSPRAAPRIYRNAVVFLAPDQNRLQDLDRDVRNYLAWQSIVDDKDNLNIDPLQVRQAQTRLKDSDARVKSQIREVFTWLLVPMQKEPQAETAWEAFHLRADDHLAVRASKRLAREELLVVNYGGTRLRMDLDKVPLWQAQENHVAVRELAYHYAQYTYLQRVADPAVIADAVRSGVSLLTWEADAFAYAESYDDKEDRYVGLRVEQQVPPLTGDSPGLVVRPEVARKQLDAELSHVSQDPDPPDPDPDPPDPDPDPPKPDPKRFYGSVEVDPLRERPGAKVAEIADEVIVHLTRLKGSDVQLTLEIEARVDAGVPEKTVRIVTENARSLGFKAYAFEDE